MTWADCLRYLEAECNPSPQPWPASTLRYAQTLWVLAEALAVRTVLEIGVGPTSVSGMVFAHSMGSRGGGMLVSMDIDPGRPADTYRAKARDLGVVWEVHHGDSLRMPWPSPFLADLVYVDGDHDEAHAYSDTVKAVDYLKPGGYLVIDDYPTDAGVVDAAKRLEADGFTFVHLAHEPPHGNGRLVWQKPEAA
jgi:predicted O-methyltransferase YrrM